MLPNFRNGRTNVGTVSLGANELKFSAERSLAITLSRSDLTGRIPGADQLAARAKWSVCTHHARLRSYHTGA
jgi:hypothetical protein